MNPKALVLVFAALSTISVLAAPRPTPLECMESSVHAYYAANRQFPEYDLVALKLIAPADAFDAKSVEAPGISFPKLGFTGQLRNRQTGEAVAVAGWARFGLNNGVEPSGRLFAYGCPVAVKREYRKNSVWKDIGTWLRHQYMTDGRRWISTFQIEVVANGRNVVNVRKTEYL